MTKTSEQHRLQALRMALKCGDLGHAAKSLEVGTAQGFHLELSVWLLFGEALMRLWLLLPTAAQAVGG